MMSVDPNLSATNLSFAPMEIPRVSSNPDPESMVSKTEDGSPSRSPPSGSRVSDSSVLSLSIHGFQTGDMVWGKVESHPWWPGQIFNEAFASPSVRRTKTGAHVLVAFFGDSSYGWFDPSELVPFGPTFLEKSKQTSARSFLNAVEESVDEFSRRAALGLSCICRSPYSFRPTHVPGYFAVDVPGFERGGLYSAEQIETARKEFLPEDCLSFVLRLALAPLSTKAGDAECIKKTATALALRKATYEEFDDTYAEAFGKQPVRPAQDDLDEEPEKFAPKAAPLSGPLVIAEPQGSSTNGHTKRSFSNDSLKKKNKNKNKNEYVLKRRDPHPTAVQKRRTEVTDDRKPVPMLSQQPPLPLRRVDADKPLHANSVVGKANEEKIKKRPRPHEDHDKNGEPVEKKKKKLATGIDDTQSEPARTSDLVVSAPKLDMERLKSPDLLHDLLALASDPYYIIERNAASIVSQVFLKFRSAVYKKSLVLPLASNANDEETNTRNPKEPKEKTPNAKEVSLIKRYSDPSNAGTKRPLSDGPEEPSSVKKIKKLDQLKPIANEKKAVASASMNASERREPLLPLPPKKFSPTNLIMKFPPNKTLPSIAQLKARFVRFGKIVVEGCRVNWEEHLCRVQFAYKVNALNAYEYASANDVFGNVKVSYSVKEVEVPSEPGRPLLRPEIPSQLGQARSSTGNSVARPRPIGPLKSILKKPGEDAGKEGQRVKFNLDSDGRQSVPTAATVRVGFHDAPPLPPPSAPMPEPTNVARVPSLPLRKPTNFVSVSEAMTGPMPPQPSAIRTFKNRPTLTVPSESDLRRQVQQYGAGSTAKAEETKKSNGVDDVARAVLSVLIALNEIMNRLKSLPGFVLYRIDR